MKRKIASIVLTVIMILSLAPCAFAETIASGDCGDSATWTLDSDGTLTISGTGVADYDGWRRADVESIEKVVIGEGITELDDFLIRNLTNMTEIEMPDSLTRIGDGIFSGCSSLENLNIPKNVNNIGDIKLGQCGALGSITVNGNNEYYKAVDDVLYTKDGKTLVAYPPALANTSYNVPEGTETVETNVFSGASNLKTVTIPSTVTNLYSYFSGCSSLEGIVVSADNANYVSDNGVLFNKDKTTLCTYPRAKSGAYTIPQGVETVRGKAFAESKGLSSVTVPDSVKVIREEAFKDCAGLEEIYIPNSVISMQDYAFGGCTALKSAVIDAATEDIYADTFNGCKSLETVELPESITTIRSRAFYGCDSLKSIILPEGCTTIGQEVFYSCYELSSIYMPSTMATIDYNAFNRTDVNDIYYNGTSSSWSAMTINPGNDSLTRTAEIHYTLKPSVNGELQYNSETGVVTVPLRATSMDCTLMAAVYKDNALVSVVSKPLEKDASSDSITVTADNADEIVVFIWDGFSGAEPMCGNRSITLR